MNVKPSQHLLCETWPQRGDASQSVHGAWERGQPLDVSITTRGQGRIPWHDEARYDPVTLTVIFRRSHTLTTCYSVAPEHVTNDHGRAVREAVETQYGPVESHRQSTASCDVES